MRTLYPDLEPFDSGTLRVDARHALYYEQCGNPEGKPVVVLHPKGFARLWGPYQTEGRALESATDAVAGISADDAARAVVTKIREVL